MPATVPRGGHGPLTTMRVVTSAGLPLFRGWRMLLLVAAVVAGLAVLHHAGGSFGTPGHRHAGDGAAHDRPAAVAEHAVLAPPCSHTTDHPGHPHGQVCPAKPGTATTVSPPRTVVAHVAVTAPAVAVTPRTADHDAAGGSGCGPPGRALLSVWRI